VLIAGAAGIGKTSLVRAFVLDRTDRVRVLVGACDDLVTPRTLGPLRDAVRAAARSPRRWPRATATRCSPRSSSSARTVHGPPCWSSRTSTGPMVLSIRTVDHHVPAVLQKVGITSRREAAGAAARVGVV